MCMCDDDWFGRGCDVSDGILEAVWGVRDLAVGVMRSSLEQLDTATPEEADQALSVIAGIFRDPGELPPASRQLLQTILRSLLDKVIDNA